MVALHRVSRGHQQVIEHLNTDRQKPHGSNSGFGGRAPDIDWQQLSAKVAQSL